MAGNNKHLSTIKQCKWSHSPIKRHSLADLILKKDPTLSCLQGTHLTSKDKIKVKGWKMIFYKNKPESNQDSYSLSDKKRLQDDQSEETKSLHTVKWNNSTKRCNKR